RAGATLTLYRNGVSVASRSDLPSATSASLTGTIGRQTTLYPAKAAIDEVAVYNSALSAATVQGHYLGSRVPQGLIGASRNAGAELNWSDPPVPGWTGYDVYRATSPGGPYTKVNGAPAAPSAFADSGLT